MPELPEVEAWVRELDPLVARAPIERAGAGARRDAEVVRSATGRARSGRTFAGARRRGKNLLFPTADGELIAARAPDERRAAPLRRTGGEDARRRRCSGSCSTDGGRARADGGGQESPGRRLAPRARGARRGAGAPRTGRARRRRGGLAEILGRERRQLHPLLRDQRALAGIGRAHANEILWRAQLSPFRLSTDLADEEVDRLAATIHDDLERALELRIAARATTSSTSSTAGSASRARAAATRSAASRSRSTRSRTAPPARRVARC